MSRKRWTRINEESESLLQFREKRKWQIALRRYVLEKNKSSFYAPYFGIDINGYREWIEAQFDEDLNWDNFSKAWQFDHIVPVAYFDFMLEEDLRLCWNFVNIQVQKVDQNKNRGDRIDALAAKTYFEVLVQKTGYAICRKMVEKISSIEETQIAGNEKIESFIIQNKNHLDILSDFSSYEYDKLNTGTDLKSILFEKEFLKKFGD